LFQILTELKNQSYVNVKQHSMIEQKIRTRNLEVENHIKHFDFIRVH